MTPSVIETVFYALILSTVAGMPLIMAAFCCTPLRRTTIHLLPLATIPALLVPLTVPDHISVEVGWFFMGGHMGLDGTGRIFLTLAGFVWLLASCSSRSMLANDTKRARFHIFFLTAMAGNFGLILAQGMFGYYLFFAIMSFATYGLIVHAGNEDARSAGRIYLFLVMIGEMALFTALVILVHRCGSLTLADITGASYHPLTLVLLFVGFGIKTGALPLHGWMMPSYQQAPIPAAAALAGSMVNAGILGWLRFLPPGKISCPQGAMLFIVAGALAAIYGVISGMRSKQAGAVLGGSSISQMGLITVIFGIGLLNLDAGLHAAPILILYVVHHGLAKSSLFFAYDLIERQGKIVSNLQLAAILLPALALAGLPFTSGAIAKTAFKELAIHLGEPWYGLSTFFLPVTAMGTTVLMLHFVAVIRSSRGDGKPGRMTAGLIFAVSFTAVAITLWLWPASDGFSRHSIVGAQLLHGLWPVAGGCLLFQAWRRIAFTTGIQVNKSRRTKGLDTLLNWLERLLQEKKKQRSQQLRLVNFWNRLVPQLRRVEKIMGRWKVVGISYIVLCFCLLLLLL